MAVGRIDRSMPPRRADGSPADDRAATAAFDAALGGQRKEPVAEEPAPVAVRLPQTPDPPTFMEILPRSQLPLPEPLPWRAPRTIHSVIEALRTMSGMDRPTSRRLLARFGGALDAGQLAYVLDSSAAVATAVIALLDEVGDGKLGAEELDPGSIKAALALLEDGEPE